MEALKEKKIQIMRPVTREIGAGAIPPARKNGRAFLAFFTGADASGNSAAPLPALQKEIPTTRGPSKGFLGKLSETFAGPISKIGSVQSRAQKISASPKEVRGIPFRNAKAETPEEKQGSLISLRWQIFVARTAALTKQSIRDFLGLLPKPRFSMERIKFLSIPRQGSAPVKRPSDKLFQNSQAIHRWVALEEKIVHDYGKNSSPERKQPGRRAFLPEMPVMPRTATFSRPGVSEVLPPVKKGADPKTTLKRSVIGNFFRFTTIALLAGWFIAAIFAFLYSGQFSENFDLSAKYEQVRGAKEELEKNVESLQSAVSVRENEARQLQGQVNGFKNDLAAVQSRTLSLKTLERNYRDELSRITIQYEQKLASFRGDLRTRDEKIRSLQSQLASFQRSAAAGGIVSFSGGAAVASSQPALARGKVIMSNETYEFVVVDFGSDQGVRAGSIIEIEQQDSKRTRGQVERVYPRFAAVTPLDPEALDKIQEGDPASLVLF